MWQLPLGSERWIQVLPGVWLVECVSFCFLLRREYIFLNQTDFLFLSFPVSHWNSCWWLSIKIIIVFIFHLCVMSQSEVTSKYLNDIFKHKVQNRRFKLVLILRHPEKQKSRALYWHRIGVKWVILIIACYLLICIPYTAKKKSLKIEYNIVYVFGMCT